MAVEIFSDVQVSEEDFSFYLSAMEKEGTELFGGLEEGLVGAEDPLWTANSDSDGSGKLSPTEELPSPTPLDPEIADLLKDIRAAATQGAVSESSAEAATQSPLAAVADHSYLVVSPSPPEVDEEPHVPNAPPAPVLSARPAAAQLQQPKARIIPKRKAATSVAEVVAKQRRAASPPRSPSPTPSSHSGWGGSNSKQALYARDYRAQNKKKVAEMEAQIKVLESRNAELEAAMSTKEAAEKEMREEISYLSSVLRHDSQLASLVGGLQQGPQGRLLLPAQPPSTAASDAQRPATRSKTSTTPAKASSSGLGTGLGAGGLGSAGLCLHVQDAGFSVELCKTCNQRSRSLLSH